MNVKVRDAILGLIRTVQEQADGVHCREQVQLSKRIDTPGTRGGLSSSLLALCFGYGYFQPSLVLVYLDEKVVGQAEAEEAADAYCEGRVPKTTSYAPSPEGKP